MYGNLKNRCVRCRSASRERAEALYFKQSGLVEEWQHQKLLHFAPELGMYFFLKKNLKEYVCCDIDPSQYPDREVEQQDILALTYGDETFDGILCNHVLEHIVDDKKAMQELFRVLKKGGKAILTVPIDDTLSKTKEDLSITDPEIRKREYWQEDHVRLYAKDGFIRRLQAVGFTAVAVRPTLREEEFHHYGVWTEVWIFVATK
jgi:SAM-dependent methyltransferase